MDLPTPPPDNMPKLFADYKSKMGVTPGTTGSVIDVLGRYLSDELDTDTSCLTFWHEHPKYTRKASSRCSSFLYMHRVHQWRVSSAMAASS